MVPRAGVHRDLISWPFTPQRVAVPTEPSRLPYVIAVRHTSDVTHDFSGTDVEEEKPVQVTGVRQSGRGPGSTFLHMFLSFWVVPDVIRRQPCRLWRSLLGFSTSALAGPHLLVRGGGRTENTFSPGARTRCRRPYTSGSCGKWR
jgi:hypothetical protein